jgi:hypothetical protein
MQKKNIAQNVQIANIKIKGNNVMNLLLDMLLIVAIDIYVYFATKERYNCKNCVHKYKYENEKEK